MKRYSRKHMHSPHNHMIGKNRTTPCGRGSLITVVNIPHPISTYKGESCG